MTATHSRLFTDSNAPNVLFMPGVFNETMQLLTDAHEYFYLFGEDDQSRIDENLKTLYSCEMSRITLRLSSIMAWIMVQRAVFSGKILPEEAATRYGLDFQDVCMVDNRMLHGVLPSYVCYLLDRTLELYERVLRLDRQIDRIALSPLPIPASASDAGNRYSARPATDPAARRTAWRYHRICVSTVPAAAAQPLCPRHPLP